MGRGWGFEAAEGDDGGRKGAVGLITSSFKSALLEEKCGSSGGRGFEWRAIAPIKACLSGGSSSFTPHVHTPWVRVPLSVLFPPVGRLPPAAQQLNLIESSSSSSSLFCPCGSSRAPVLYYSAFFPGSESADLPPSQVGAHQRTRRLVLDGVEVAFAHPSLSLTLVTHAPSPDTWMTLGTPAWLTVMSGYAAHGRP